MATPRIYSFGPAIRLARLNSHKMLSGSRSRKERLEGRSSLEICGDRRIDAGHTGLIREDEAQFAILTQ